MSDFRRMRWAVKGDKNSMPKLQVLPRISMIMGISTNGAIYTSLLQANSNSKVMDLFFRQLAKKHDKERKEWRYDTMILMDNAPYHTCAATMKLLEELDIPVIFTGPHSYDAAPL